MRIYELKLDKPRWFFDPPTNRQIKVLKFFGYDSGTEINKGKASGILASIFRDKEKAELWEKYVFWAGDETQDSPDLVPFDLEELQKVVVPDDWKPKGAAGISSERKERLRKLVSEMMREGTPFDDPVPEIQFPRFSYAFTGKFSSGTRTECQDAVEKLGAISQKSVNMSTNYLVIGNEGSENWSEGSHGRKIEKAMILRMELGKPFILSESDWLEAVQRAAP